MLWYRFGPFDANVAVGRDEEALALVDATLTMYLRFFGFNIDQVPIRHAQRPNRNYKNTNSKKLAAFARPLGLETLVRVHCRPILLRQFLSNGLSVLVDICNKPKPDDRPSYYRVITGYDDARCVWIAYDSFICQERVRG